MPGLTVINRGAETLTFGVYGCGFRRDARPLTLAPGETWVELHFWQLMLAQSAAVSAALASGEVAVGAAADRPVAAMHAIYDLQWPLP